MTPAIQQYLERRKLREKAAWKPRVLCARCDKPGLTCYCAHVRPFTPKTQFVILIHPHEVGRRVASGMMAHLCLNSSRLIEGENFSNHNEVNALITSPNTYPVLLAPGQGSVNLTGLTAEERSASFPAERRLVVFILDGTWAEAKRIARFSENLKQLPRFCFTPPHMSRFVIRRQPEAHCFASIEAIHYFLELTEGNSPAHDTLIEVFTHMIHQQMKFERTHSESRHRDFTLRRQLRRTRNLQEVR